MVDEETKPAPFVPGEKHTAWRPMKRPLLCAHCKQQLGLKGSSPALQARRRHDGARVYLHAHCLRAMTRAA